MKTRTLLLALALLAPTAVGHAQQDAQQKIEAARQRAEAAGIPTALLDAKVAEGRAKGVDAGRIAAAVERRLASLARARDAMASPRGGAVSASDLSVGADALEAGVDAAVLGALAVDAPSGSRAVAVAVLTQLVREGESSERALARVQAALARGPEALRRLPGQAAAERARSAPPAGRGLGAAGEARGSGRSGGPPASIPGPGGRPERPRTGSPGGKPGGAPGGPPPGTPGGKP